VLQNFASVRTASRSLISAQGESLVRAIRRLAPPGVLLTQEALLEVVARYRDLGLRCVALVDGGRVAARAGDCETPDREMAFIVRELRPGEVGELGPRACMVDRLPPPPPPAPGGQKPLGEPDDRPSGEGGPLLGDADSPPPRNRLSPPRDRPPPPRETTDPPTRDPNPPPPEDALAAHIMIEFEPRLADRLNATAARGLVVGVAATLLLGAAAIVFSRLSRRAEALQGELERDRRLATLGEMSAVMAHEIRNPLASLKGHAQLLEEQLEPPQKAKAERIVHEAVRLEALCEDLLSLVRSNRVERTNTDPAALMREAAASVPEHAFELVVANAPPTWPLDPHRMHLVLVNLLRNAAQASPPNHPARASIDVDGHRLVFSVRDFGAGVTPGDEERIFEPFHTTRLRGTGLGLAVARRIVELHGGGVTVSNHPQGGAVFRVAVPRT
jgi:two-component system, NtrC family, sensor histidine kinase HydH